MMTFDYDIVVIGAGHAGCEAAHAAARLGASTCLITMDMNKVCQMSCNPAVGGIAKGQIVREIDALGGMMGRVTDATSIQFRMLNRSKGPAVWSPRSQADRARFIWTWRKVIDATPGLSVWQDTVTELLTEPDPDAADAAPADSRPADSQSSGQGPTQDRPSEGRRRVCGVRTQMGVTFHARAVILTAGTFLSGLMHIGRTMIAGGRVAEPASYGLTEQLTALGLRAGRMKTGTPVRIDGRTVDFTLAERQDGDDDFHHFSFLPDDPLLGPTADRPAPARQGRSRALPCWTVQTNTRVHDILRSGLPDSPLYNGQIQSIGPRYCPSIETKLVTFADKDHHLLFLEPEGTDTAEYYLNGFSSSLPIDVQLAALREIPALRNVKVYRPGYAIEYDYFDPTQLSHTLQSRVVGGLYLAGQVNGTTGYEEAAGQGIVAGINAAHQVLGRAPFTLGRDEAYIGVLIDDLVTKGVDEPYRMFTSRAEYRILLRQDDADMRLTPRGYAIGLADQRRHDLLVSKRRQVDQIIEFCETFHVKLSINEALVSLGSTPLKEGTRLVALVGRPELSLSLLAPHISELADLIAGLEPMRRDEIVEAAEVRIKYAGYIERERQNADKLHRLEKIALPHGMDYASLHGLTIEARQKLAALRPDNIGQASRIPGVSPADISILLILLGR